MSRPNSLKVLEVLQVANSKYENYVHVSPMPLLMDNHLKCLCFYLGHDSAFVPLTWQKIIPTLSVIMNFTPYLTISRSDHFGWSYNHTSLRGDKTYLTVLGYLSGAHAQNLLALVNSYITGLSNRMVCSCRRYKYYLQTFRMQSLELS